MSKYHESDKGKWLAYFEMQPRPHGLTKAMLKRALTVIWDDDYFWFQCAERFGFCDKPFHEIDDVAKDRAATNFGAMIREKATQ